MQILEKKLQINQVRHNRADERPADGGGGSGAVERPAPRAAGVARGLDYRERRRGGTTKTRRTAMILRSVWPFYII